MSRTPRRILNSGLTAAVALSLVALGGCGSTDAGRADTVVAGAEVAGGVVSPQRAAELAADPSITVLDVRTPEEFAEGHLAGATLVDFRNPTFADDVAKLDRAGRYLVYCRSGNRSAQAVAVMRGLGFGEVYDMEGGVIAWSEAGLPLEN